MRKYKNLMGQADLRKLRELADKYSVLELEYREALKRQARAHQIKFNADSNVYRLEVEQRKTAREMRQFIWRNILAPEDYLPNEE